MFPTPPSSKGQYFSFAVSFGIFALMAEATQAHKPSAYRLFEQGNSFEKVHRLLPISRATAHRWWTKWKEEKAANRQQEDAIVTTR